MTAVYPFVPSPQAAFQFQPTLDGQQYTAVVSWNVTGQRWYLSLFDLSGSLVVTLPVIGSPEALQVQALYWKNGRAVVTTRAPHGLVVGELATLTVMGCSPDAYNGAFLMTASSPSQFFYELAGNPGDVQLLGTVGARVNILGAYLQTSSLVFNESLSQFEVMP